MAKRFAVIRDCCTIGNCDSCNGVTPFGTKLRVCQTSLHSGITKKYATTVAANWHAYNAEVVTLDEARLIDGDTRAKIEEKHKRNEPIRQKFEELQAAEKKAKPPKATYSNLEDLFKF